MPATSLAFESSSKTGAASNVRCVTLIGHVDHGKSSYADSLLAANGIISSRMAGKIRYLDSREDEQERGITIESSAVTLTFKMRKAPSGKAAENEAGAEATPPPIEDFLVNLIDTPGHVDFSSEVSSASRLCDGALVIVDAVEGVCTQTTTVLRQAWADKLTPILVINKVDRLITELRLAPIEAYHHLSQLIEQVNAVMGACFAAERMEDDYQWSERQSKAAAGPSAAAGEAFEERSDEQLYFDPVQGNVIFASALDGWAFRLDRFSALYASKLGVSEAKLRKVLWGEFYFDPKGKRVLSAKQRDKEGGKLAASLRVPMAVQFVLDNVWRVYNCTVIERDQEKIDKVVTTLNLKVAPRDLKSKDPSSLLTAVFSSWLPLAACTFAAIASEIPSPAAAQAVRIPRMLGLDDGANVGVGRAAHQSISKQLVADLSAALPSSSSSRCAYISKLFVVRREDLPDSKKRPLTADEMREKGRVSREKAKKREKERQEQIQAALKVSGAGGDGVEEPSVATTPSDAEAMGPMPIDPAKLAAEKAAEDQGTTVEEAEEESPEIVLGIARLYSGTLRVGGRVYAILPKYDSSLGPTHPANAKHVQRVKIEGLYMIMGRDLVPVQQVPAGNICGIRGLEGIVLRNGTLCAAPEDEEQKDEETEEERLKRNASSFVNLANGNALAAPIVRVALEPTNPSDMPKLVAGLRLLNQADPCVETLVQESGEHVIITAGELHLERCLKDLRERFARCGIQASAPLVPFRETAVKGVDMAPPRTAGEARGTIVSSVANESVRYTVRARPLPKDVTAFLLANTRTLHSQIRDRRAGTAADAADEPESVTQLGSRGGTGVDEESSAAYTGPVTPARFWPTLEGLLQKAGPEWKDVANSIWAFGPRRVGPNLLVDRAGLLDTSLRQRLEARRLHAEGLGSSGIPTPAVSKGETALDSAALTTATEALHLDAQGAATGSAIDGESRSSWSAKDLLETLDTGFQIATLQGPLCAEPVQGMAYFVERLEVDDKEAASVRLSQVTGSLISSMREACRHGLLDWSPRLMLAMYACDIQASTEVLGKVHAVLSRRRGRITSEEMKEGTSFFTVGSVLPVVESFGFADEIRTRTSGAASPQLVFKGFDLFDLDPFWVPRTEEELEDLGEKGDRENVAKRYMDAVRKRKGMFIERRIVEAAEKQRTLKSN